MDSGGVAKQLRRIRTLGRGASGAVVWLASDEASGELLAVKSAPAGVAAQLRREGRVMEGLSSPHIVPCLGARAAAGGEYQLFLEFAPGGSLADEAARCGGRLPEQEIQTYAADIAHALAYLHELSLVHGDVKARNVVIGGDGRARLTDFGCARPAESTRPIGGTPAFMAPEVARGEEQGPAADVWALGCTVVEMATGRAPWSDMDDVLAAIHRIGYTDAVPEVPAWMSEEAKDFLACCFARNASDRCTAAQLLEHPFIAFAALDFDDARPAKPEHLSPKSTLHDAFWDSDTDDETDDMSTSPAERISALATSALPDWDSDEGWIDLQDEHHQTVHATPEASEAALAAEFFLWFQPTEAEAESEQSVSFGDATEDLPQIPVVTQTDVSVRPGSFSECKIQYSFDHERIDTVRSHCVCNTNKVLMTRILLKIPFRGHLVGTIGTFQVRMNRNRKCFHCFLFPDRRKIEPGNNFDY